MKINIKKLIDFILASAVLVSMSLTVVVFCATDAEPKEIQYVTQIQKKELQKSQSEQLVRFQIKENQKRLERFEKVKRTELDQKLVELLHSKQDYSHQRRKCSWYNFTSLAYLTKKITETQNKILRVKRKITRNENKIRKLKKNKERLDAKLESIFKTKETDLKT